MIIRTHSNESEEKSKEKQGGTTTQNRPWKNNVKTLFFQGRFLFYQ